MCVGLVRMPVSELAFIIVLGRKYLLIILKQSIIVRVEVDYQVHVLRKRVSLVFPSVWKL